MKNINNLKGEDLLEFLTYVMNTPLEYRNSLNLPKEVTFGIEIEYERMIKRLIDKYIDKIDGWFSVSDSSLIFGGEINSPVMTDEITYWKDIKKVCEYLEKRKVVTHHNAGGHIHLGAHILGEDINAWRKLLKIYIIYESELNRFLYGDKINGRQTIRRYAHPLRNRLLRSIKTINKAERVKDLRIILKETGAGAISFYYVNFFSPEEYRWKNTIEFRCPNSSTDEIIWQNNINTLSKLLLVSKEDIDEEYLDYKIMKKDFNEAYDVIALRNVLELTDLIFSESKDKVYFLRQYLKDLEEREGLSVAVKSKKFTRKR